MWIELRLEDGDRPYLVLDPDGTPLGRVVVSNRGRIGAAQRDRIWVIEADSVGVQSVIRYAVSWGDARR